jgi:uncharacterized delta-60 repeat protein
MASASIFNNLNDICEVNHLIIQPDGKIIVIGKAKTATGTQQYASVRFLPNGSLDATFGVNGVAVYNPFSTPAFLADINCLTLQIDGKTIIGVNYKQYNTDSDERMLCIRLNANGSLDTSYGMNGYNFISNGLYTSSNMLLQPDGKLLVVGRSEDVTTTYRNYILRLNSNGSYDTAFNNTGFNLLPSPLLQGTAAGFLSVYLQPDGKILAIGHGYTGFPYTILSRFNSELLGMDGFGKREVSIYPNPSEGVYTLDLTSSKEAFTNITVYNVLGEEVLRMNITPNSLNQIDLTVFPTGYYTAKLFNSTHSIPLKLIKK